MRMKCVLWKNKPYLFAYQIETASESQPDYKDVIICEMDERIVELEQHLAIKDDAIRASQLVNDALTDWCKTLEQQLEQVNKTIRWNREKDWCNDQVNHYIDMLNKHDELVKQLQAQNSKLTTALELIVSTMRNRGSLSYAYIADCMTGIAADTLEGMKGMVKGE